MTKEEKILALKTDLERRAAKKWPNDEARQRRYVYGTIQAVKAKL